MRDNLTGILERKRSEEATQERGEAPPLHPYPATRKELVGACTVVALLLIGAFNYDRIKEALGPNAATVVQVSTAKGMPYLYLNDGTVWLLDADKPVNASTLFYVAPGDEIRFEHPQSVPALADPSIVRSEYCTLYDATREQLPTLAMRVAGDPKRDSCPAGSPSGQ